jgi:membrane protein
MRLTDVWNLFKSSISRFFDEGSMSLAASLAYYTLFSLPPLLYLLFQFLVWSLGFFYDDSTARASAALKEQVGQLIGTHRHTHGGCRNPAHDDRGRELHR